MYWDSYLSHQSNVLTLKKRLLLIHYVFFSRITVLSRIEKSLPDLLGFWKYCFRLNRGRGIRIQAQIYQVPPPSRPYLQKSTLFEFPIRPVLLNYRTLLRSCLPTVTYIIITYIIAIPPRILNAQKLSYPV